VAGRRRSGRSRRRRRNHGEDKSVCLVSCFPKKISSEQSSLEDLNKVKTCVVGGDSGNWMRGPRRRRGRRRRRECLAGKVLSVFFSFVGHHSPPKNKTKTKMESKKKKENKGHVGLGSSPFSSLLLATSSLVFVSSFSGLLELPPPGATLGGTSSSSALLGLGWGGLLRHRRLLRGLVNVL